MTRRSALDPKRNIHYIMVVAGRLRGSAKGKKTSLRSLLRYPAQRHGAAFVENGLKGSKP
ncbi:MAG: hypothetical protein IID38_11720 [Planctomycetes bacterium]|nr:hypothetical protein [Planctomycetota bacterium]